MNVSVETRQHFNDFCQTAGESCDLLLDLVGLKCPEPLMMLRQGMRQLKPGAIVGALATDPSTERDFSAFCQHLGHELKAFTQHQDAQGKTLFFKIQKRNA